MRILKLCYEYPPLGGGGSKVVRGLAAGLASEGHEVDLITSGFGTLPSDDRIDSVRIRRVASLRRRMDRSGTAELLSYAISASLAAIRAVRRQRYDTCHAHFIFPDGLVAWILRLLTGQRYIITAHGSDVPGYNPHRFKLMHRLLAPLWRAIVGGADCVVCPSPTLQRLVAAQPGVKRTVVIPNGFDPQRLRPGAARRNRVLCVTRLFERKGVQHVIDALARLDQPPILDVVGDGPFLAALKARAAETGVQVDFHGWLDNDSQELAELYRTSSIFVLASSVENFPVCLLEAMSAGLAVVTTADTGCADVVGEAGLLVPHGDIDALAIAIDRLASDPKLGSSYGKRARERLLDRFVWTKVVAQYLGQYERRLVAREPTVRQAVTAL